MSQFVTDDDRNHTRPFLAFVRGQLTDPNRIRIEYDDPRFRYQVSTEICSLLDDGTLEKAPHIRLLSDLLSSEQVAVHYRAACRRIEELEEMWRSSFERAFAKHAAALPPPRTISPPRDVAVAAKAGEIEKVLRLLDSAENQHAFLTADDREVVIGLAEQAGHPELETILDQHSLWGDETPIEMVRNAARDGIAQAQLDLAWRLFDSDERTALKWAERAAAQHHPRACAVLGRWLEEGIGVPPNHAAAKRCYERSAELGDAHGMYLLGEMHRIAEPADNDAAFFWLNEASMMGHPDAMVSLGILYEYGEGREPDAKRAFRLYSDAAATDEETGVMEVARCHADGVGTPRNLELAFRHYQQAANLGYEDAYRAMGWAYANGLGVDKDMERAIDSYERAIALGSAGAAVALGSLRLNNGAPAEALKLFRKAQELEWTDDLSYLITRALEALTPSQTSGAAGKRTTEKSAPTDDSVAVDIDSIRRSAESGDITAMITLGRCHINGTGVAQDRNTGLNWLRRAAATSNDAALCALGDEICDEQPQEAARLYERAAVHGDPDGQFSWGQCLEYGEGTAQDERAAVLWYRRSAAGGLAGAQHRLGIFHLNGMHGVPLDEREGVKLLKLAAEEWHSLAMEDLAAWYLSRPDATEALDREAVALLQKTVKQGGGANAYSHLGFCYRTGRGVEKDLAEAERLFLKAIEEGEENAHAKLANLYLRNDERDKGLAVLDRGIAANEVESMTMRAEEMFGDDDPTGAIALLRKAAEIDPEDSDTRFMLAQCFAEGHGTSKDVDKAIALYEGLAEEDDSRAYAPLAAIYRERGDEVSWLEWINRGIRENDPDCMVQQAQSWLHTTTTKDEWAVQLLRKAVELENSDARFLLGYCLGFDRGGSDIKEAERLLTDESLQGDEEAVTYLMFLYLDRLRDVPRAVEVARRGAALNSSDCMTMLGVAHELGVGATRDFDEAMRWYQRALKLNDLGAMLHLARISLDRSKPLHNPARAFSLLEQASKHEDVDDPAVMIAAVPNVRGHLWYQIALCWEHGAGTPANLVKAIVNYRRAKEAGSKEAAAALARLESPG